MNIASYNKWCKENETERFWDSAEDAAYAAWKAATLAERERCDRICQKLAAHFKDMPMSFDAFRVAVNAINGLYEKDPELGYVYDF